MHESWDSVELGDLVAETHLGTTSRAVGGVGDLTLLKMGSLQGGTVDCSQIEPVASSTIPNLEYIRLRRGDLLFNTRNTPNLVGKVGVWRDEASDVVPDNNLLILRFGPEVDSPYVGAQLSFGAPSRRIRSLATGTTSVSAIYWRDLRRVRVPVPSAPEQRRITDTFDALDGQINNARRCLGKLKFIELGQRKAIFGNEQPSTPGSEFQLMRVDDVGEVKLGRQRSPEHASGARMNPYLRVANVLDGYVDYSDTLRMNFSLSESSIFELNSGDVLLNEGQSLDLVGRCAIYDGPPGMCFQNTLIRFRPRRVSPEYARAVFKFWLDSGRFASVAKQTTSIAHLGADRLASMTFPYVSEDEQRRLVSTLRRIEETERKVELEISKLCSLKQALMDDLLTGRVRVGDHVREG